MLVLLVVLCALAAFVLYKVRTRPRPPAPVDFTLVPGPPIPPSGATTVVARTSTDWSVGKKRGRLIEGEPYTLPNNIAEVLLNAKVVRRV